VRVQELNTRLYVDRDAAGLNNGASWADAFINLRAACETAALFPDHVPREIWIAGGTYTPSQTGDPAAYFPLTPNTSYIGGFAGGETGKGQRSPAANPVVISGDLGGARSRHLFYGASIPAGELVFEDLSFAGAKTLAGTGQDHSGAALSVSANGGTVRIQGCAFTDLEAGNSGGAVYVIGAGLDLSESGFDSCRVPTSSSGKHGGAVYVALPNQAGAAVNVDQVTFNASSAGRGGAMSVSANGGMVRIQGCAFTDLEADDRGGAVYVNDAGLELSESRFDSCRATTVGYGGAVFAALPNQAGAAVNVDHVTFNATAAGFGGAVYIWDIYENNNAVNFSHISLENVFAASYGGFYVKGQKNAVTMSHITINKTIAVATNTRSGINVASSNGGAVDISEVELYNAGITSDNSKGMIKLENITVTNSPLIQNNNISISGGANISNVTVEGTWPASSIAAVYIYNSLGGQDVHISGLTIRNINGSGLYISNSSQSTAISDLAISNTTSSSFGGGAYIQTGGSLSIRNTTISNTTTPSFGGGAYIFLNGSFYLENTTISETHANDAFGGLYIDNTTLTQPSVISGLRVINTTASAIGGIKYYNSQASAGSLLIKDTIISASAPSTAGAHIRNGSGFSIVNTVINGTDRSGSYPGYNHYWD
jgi:hypothetical protein